MSIVQLLQELKTFWGSARVSFVATDSTFHIPKISTRYLSPFALRPVATGGGRRIIFSNFILWRNCCEASTQPLEASPQMLSSLRLSPPLASSPPMEASPPFRSHSEICELISQVKQSEKVAAACIEEFIANNDSEVIEPEKTKATPAEVPKQFKISNFPSEPSYIRIDHRRK